MAGDLSFYLLKLMMRRKMRDKISLVDQIASPQASGKHGRQ